MYNLRTDAGVSYDVDVKTGRFLMIRPADPLRDTPSSVRIVLNWMDLVRHTSAPVDAVQPRPESAAAPAVPSADKPVPAIAAAS